MNIPLLHEFRLSSKAGVGVRCDVDGAFVGDVPLLKRVRNAWKPRETDELSEELGEAYGLPVDVSPKRDGFAVIARALNGGDVARAQIATVLLQLPNPPLLAKAVPTQIEIICLALALDWSGLLKVNTRHWPAKSPDGKGGQFAPKDADTEQNAQSDSDLPDAPNSSADLPRDKGFGERRAARGATTAATETAEQAAERQASRAAIRTAVEDAAVSAEKAEIRVAARRAFREAALDALKSAGKKLALSEIPIIGELADLATVYDVYRFAKQFIELRADIRAATRFVDEGAHKLADLRVSQESQGFNNYDAFLKVGYVLPNDLEKRFGPAGDGMEYHHIIEQSSGASKAVTETTDNIVRIPTILHQAINAVYAKPAEESGNLSLREWLKTQPDDIRRMWGLKVLRDLHLIVDRQHGR